MAAKRGCSEQKKIPKNMQNNTNNLILSTMRQPNDSKVNNFVLSLFSKVVRV